MCLETKKRIHKGKGLGEMGGKIASETKERNQKSLRQAEQHMPWHSDFLAAAWGLAWCWVESFSGCAVIFVETQPFT